MAAFCVDYENGNDANSGADWANAWKTITSGATAARIGPGDTIKIAKSPAPVSIGDATWNDASKTVTLAAALTKAVDQCDSGWVAANSSTVTHPTSAMKQGSANVAITKASYATGTLYAYAALGAPTDFSGFTYITLWIKLSSNTADANRWVICLCSDAAGVTAVDSFPVPTEPQAGRWCALKLARTGGGSLGASIQSVAIYTGSSAPAGSSTISMDNIQACNGLSLQSLVSKNPLEIVTFGDEGWYGIQSIVGTTLLIDNEQSALPSAGRGYSGATETVATYSRETIKTTHTTAGTDSQAVQDSGSSGSPIVFSGGWNTLSGLQDGETIFDGQTGNGRGLGIDTKSYVTLSRLSFVRYNVGVRLATASKITASFGILSNCTTEGITISATTVLCSITISSASNNGTVALSATATCVNNDVVIGEANNNLSSAMAPLCNRFRATIGHANNNGIYGVDLGALVGCRLTLTEARSNATAQIGQSSGDNVLLNSTLSGTEVAAMTAYTDARIWSQNHNVSGFDRIFTDGGQIDSETSDFSGGNGKMWKLLTSSTTRAADYPLTLPVAQIAVVADEEVTIKATMRKAHATQVNGRLVCRGGQIGGVNADVVATLADNTSEQELTLTFTPTEDGVVEIEAWAEYVSGHAAVHVDDITEASQAA